jgi:hypothetical protein
MLTPKAHLHRCGHGDVDRSQVHCRLLGQIARVDVVLQPVTVGRFIPNILVQKQPRQSVRSFFC